MTIKCEQCGKTRIVSECRGYLKHCSRECYLESLKLDEHEILRMARMGYHRKEVAVALGISYQTLYRKLQKQNLNSLFLGRGYATNEYVNRLVYNT
jgi:DNA-binding NarL/FixJ family response regulator